MIEVLLFVCAASGLLLGSAALVLAALALRAARRYVNLAESRMELLRQGQARLIALSADGRQASRDGATFERELEELREARRKIPVSAAARSSETHQGSRGPGGRTRGDGASPVGFPDTSKSSRPSAASKRASAGSPGETKPRLGMRHPHPDDGADLELRAPSGPERAQSGAQVEMFRKHYDKYLENYRGYVELAERLHETRDDEMAPGSSEQRDRAERLRRVEDGIARTTARLDILEGLNPDLAADDRVSRRASIAQRYAELAR